MTIKKKQPKKTAKTAKKRTTPKKGKLTTKEPVNKGGRPQFSVNWKQLEKMCAIQCTQSEIAAVLGCHRDTIDEACKREYGLSFTKYFKEKCKVGKASLRHMQFKTANEGNVPMLIHLGKNLLDQKDKKEFSGGLDLKRPARDLTDDELAKIIEEDDSKGDNGEGDD